MYYPIAQQVVICYPMSTTMENLLLFQHVDSYGARLRMEGISAFAREVGWNVQSYEEHVDIHSLEEIMNLWRPVGTILGPSTGRIEYDSQLFSSESTVLLDSFPPKGVERFTTVITDSFRVSERVARELLSARCAAYGFVPWPNTRIWSENRRHNFAKILSAQGKSLEVFTPSRQDLEIREFQRELIPWLKALPKPCGIYAANDRVGTYVINACKLAQIEVPFNCIVVGVDNNENVCEGVNPTLSSITLDFYGSGYRAAQLLNELIHGRLPDKPIVSVPPLDFIRRNSSRIFLQTDRDVLRASELIRARACEGLTAQEVLGLFPYSRRLAEIRFRKATGRSVLEEIRAVRIERAKQLLKDPHRALSVIAGLCGYESDTTFRRIFKQETGLTLREYQQGLAK